MHTPYMHHYLRSGKTTSATPPAKPLHMPKTSSYKRNCLTPTQCAAEHGNIMFVFEVGVQNKTLHEFDLWPHIN